MSNILKLASALSLVLSAVAAMTVTDISLASNTSAEIPETPILVDPDLIETPDEEQDVVFVGTGEVVQKLDPAALARDASANEAAETATDVIGAGEAGSLADLVAMQDTAGSLDKEMQCLAGAIYFESKGESLAGQLAVARVVIARAESGRFPSSICGVVYQKSQFSFVRGGSMPYINRGSSHWRNAVAISKIAMNKAWPSKVEGALFFHARYVNPGWNLRRMATIDNHVFYR